MSYEEKETVLDAGEAALLYSDGLVEAHDPKGEMFGFPRLRDLVAEHAAREGSLGDFLLRDRKSTRLNSSHANISYAVFCLKKKKPNLLRASRLSYPLPS